MTMSIPSDIMFACSTASYQVEGAWNIDGKGENIWDRLTHTNPNFVSNKDNGDIACDSYHLYKEDVKLIKDIGFDMYRFSISWARILPNGDLTSINDAGIGYYHNLIDELLESGIKPMVTMYHWDLPQKLQDIGGWMNSLIVDYIEDYADLLFKLYGDKVKWWITINEPSEIIDGYSSDRYAPDLNLDSPANYIVGHNILKAHAKIFRLYNTKYRSKQQGNISISICSQCLLPKTASEEDKEATSRGWEFILGWFSHPIYSKEGDYPEIMKKVIDENSKQEGRKRSRLPTFTEEEIQFLKGSFDFFALNHYTTRLCSPGHPPFSSISLKDISVNFEVDPNWPRSKAPWLQVAPFGLKELLRFIKCEYNNPPVFITENGYCDSNDLNDIDRITYHREYIKEMLVAKEKFGCNVIGYTVWSILDNFEWKDGFGFRFGIVFVDFNDPNRKRTLKKSADFFKQLLKTRNISDV